MLAHVPVPVDIADETYVAARPRRSPPVVADPASWARWWPDLELAVTRDRGVKGVQWAVRGALTGSMEIWLEPVGAAVRSCTGSCGPTRPRALTAAPRRPGA